MKQEASSLLMLWKARAGYRPMKAVKMAGDRKVYTMLGIGPNGLMVGWADGEKLLKEFNPDDIAWYWIGLVGGPDN